MKGAQHTPETSDRLAKMKGVYRADRGRVKKKSKKRLRPIAEVEPIPIMDPMDAIAPGAVPGYDPCLHSDGFIFDAGLATDAVRFFHAKLTHVKGKLARTPFYLEPWQQAVTMNLFGWVDPDTGLRRYHECLIFVPRKNGKTCMAAGFILYLLFEDGEPGAEIYGAAADRQQAGMVFEQASGMVRHSEDLSARSRVYGGFAGQRSIQLRGEDDYSTYRIVAGHEKTLHGSSPHAAVVDELHTQPDRRLVDALITGTGSRENPLIVHLTTSDYDREGSPCNEKHDYACKVRDGLIPDPRFLPVIYEAAKKDDWKDPAVWAKANPNLGVSVRRDFLERECQRAQDEPTYENAFRRLHLNVRTEQDVRWLSVDKWDKCNAKPLPEGPCFAGLDLGITDDLSALVLYFPETKSLVPYFWTPGANVQDREKKDRVPYSTWSKSGLITLMAGEAQDQNVLLEDIMAILASVELVDLALDWYNARWLAGEMMSNGIEVLKFPQTHQEMSEPTKMLERLVVREELRHGGHPILRWMVSNCAANFGPGGHIKLDKKKSTGKIDGIIAGVMAIGRSMAKGEESCVYNKRGLREL